MFVRKICIAVVSALAIQSVCVDKGEAQQKDFLKGSIFKTGAVKPSQTPEAESTASTAKFFAKLNKQKDRQGSFFDNAFEYTLDRYHFLGEPLVAKLSSVSNGDASEFDFYLVVFHFNVPAVKYALIPTKYGFARFTAQMQLLDEGGDAVVAVNGTQALSSRAVRQRFSKMTVAQQKDKVLNLDEALINTVRTKQLTNVHVVAVHPTNEVLTVDRTDDTKHEFQIKPEFQGGAAGSYTYTKQLTDKFNFDLPKVVGIGTASGAASWTYYPAKAQPLMLGAKTTMAVVAVPANSSNKVLRILSSFNYQLCKAKVPLLWGHTLLDTKEVRLDPNSSVEDVLALHAIDIPKDLRETLSTAFPAEVKPIPQLSLAKSKRRDYIFDAKSGTAYVETAEGDWKPLNFLKKPDNPPSGNPRQGLPRIQ